MLYIVSVHFSGTFEKKKTRVRHTTWRNLKYETDEPLKLEENFAIRDYYYPAQVITPNSRRNKTPNITPNM